MKLSKKYYQNSLQTHTLKKNHIKRLLSSFVFGGGICLFSQGVLEVAKLIDEENSISIMLFVVIFISILLSGFGLYDKIGQIAYAGTIVPISGFANSMASSAMEYRPEGMLLGIAANTFKLAGSVIVYGVVATIVIGLFRIVFGLI
ncbi:MAG: SpoVA/SpoVAEb family sporulation membrane protein [bacterium]